jgi:hypothetical protein
VVRISRVFAGVVIDGGSTDGSVEILQRHSCPLAYSVSEPDAGDYELLLCPDKNLNSIFVGEVTAAMLVGGNSDCFAVLTEIQRAKIGTGGPNRVWAFWELWVERLKLAVRRVESACARFVL